MLFRYHRRRLLLTACLTVAGISGCATKREPPICPPGCGPAPMPEAVIAPADSVTRYTLGEAISIGHANHPLIQAMQASSNAAMLKYRGLNESKMSGAGLLGDFEIRKQQADLGLQASMAEIEQAGHEVTYAVIRCYYTVIYAREQVKVTKELVTHLEGYLEQVRKIVNSKGGGVKGVTKDTEDKLVIILAIARGKLIEAESGVEMARAALREAMGHGPEAQVDVADEMLPDVSADIKRDDAVAHAITRRAEVQLTRIGADVTRLEACAQWARRFTRMSPTFANGADIHAKPVPLAHRDPDYKPGAIGPEMPNRLIGTRETRTDVAEQYAERSEAAAKQARNLIALETDRAYGKWSEGSRKAASFKEAAKSARDLIERQREAAGGTITKEDILMNEVSATQALASYNEALWEQICALANLERITAGGVRVNFPGR